MEVIFEIVAWFLRAVVYFGICAILGCCQALAGVLSPSANPKVIHLQRWTVGCLLCAVVLLLAGILFAYNLHTEVIGYTLIVASLTLMIVAGILGNQAERTYRGTGESGDADG